MAQPLDIISDLMALTSHSNTRNIILIAVESKGTFDENILRMAVDKAATVFPNYKSVLREIHVGWRFHLSREHRPDIEIPIFISKLPSSSNFPTSFDAIVSYLTPRFDSQWDFWETPPLEVHVLGIGDDHRVLAFVAHHVGGDVAMALKVVSEVLGQYHAIASGEAPSWTSSPYVLSTSRKRASRPNKSGWKGFWTQLRRDLAYRKRQPQKPVGKGYKNDLREWHIKRVLSVEDTDRILRSFSSGEAHVVDHLVACTNTSLDRWNADRQAPPGFISSVVTVNMRERFGGAEEQNYSSAIFFNSGPEQRKDYGQFVLSLARARHKQFSRQLDLSLRKSIARGAKFFSLFPLGIRRRAALLFMNFQQYSVAVGYMGVVWPECTDEKMGPDSCLVKLGDAEVTDIHGTGYKLAGNAHINLYAYIYRRQMHLVVSSAARLLTKEECDRFADVFLNSVFTAAGLP